MANLSHLAATKHREEIGDDRFPVDGLNFRVNVRAHHPDYPRSRPADRLTCGDTYPFTVTKFVGARRMDGTPAGRQTRGPPPQG